MNNYRIRRPAGKREVRCLFFLKFWLLLFSVSYCAAASMHVEVLILFPKVEGPYAKVFSKIMQGIKDHPQISAKSFAVEEDTTPQAIISQLDDNMTQAVLVLGQRSYQMATKLNRNLPITVGALVTPSDSYPTISLAGDPDAFCTALKALAPQVKRVFVVYNEENSGWLIQLAKASAQQHGLELVAHPAKDVREAVRLYRTVLKNAESETDAIWLLTDRVAPIKTILPMTLDMAWKRRLVVFSSNPLYVKRGILFSLYPDYELMGRELADLAIDQFGENQQPLAIPTRNLKIAVNQRTASHLGLRYSQSQQRGFDLIYPAPH